MNLTFVNRPKILLLGNGINRAFGLDSCQDFLNMLSDAKNADLSVYNTAPFPIKAVIYSNDKVNSKIKENIPYLLNFCISAEEKEYIKKLIGKNFDSILTTNYTYEVEQSLLPDFTIKAGTSSKYRKNASGKSKKNKSKESDTYMSRYFDLQLKNCNPSIWHIHGEAAIYSSVLVGHYYYGKLISDIMTSVEKTISKYNVALKSKKGVNVTSWVDLFMIGDVYIVGQGLDLAEFDLWWLLKCKRTHFPDTKVIWYEKSPEPIKRRLAEIYGVDVMCSDRNEYLQFYQDTLDNLS